MKYLVILFCCLITTAAHANNLPPVAVIDENPNRSWFYNLEEVVFTMDNSYDDDGYINYTKWYINGVYQTGGSYSRSMSTCFALDGSPQGDCYQLASGATTVQVKLEVRDNSGEWSSKTTTYTIKTHKGRKYFIKDHLGSVRTTVNRDGNVLGYDDYYPFGSEMPNRSENTSNPNDNYKFTGHERDEDANLTLDYMMARNYDPEIGRFMQIDPLADQFPGWTPYHYVHNNPLNLIDPTGMAAECPDGCVELPDQVSVTTTTTIDGVDHTEVKTVQINYENTSSDGVSADQKVNPELAEAISLTIAEASLNSDITSVTIKATTNGEHSENSRHYGGKAVDINKINGTSVSEHGASPQVTALQNAFEKRTGARENFGPAMMKKSGGEYINDELSTALRQDRLEVKRGHQNHLHFSVD